MFDSGSLLVQILTDVIAGLETEDLSLTDMLCTKISHKSLEGTIPFMADEESLARDFGDQAPGTGVKYIDSKLTTLSWAMKSYSVGFRIPKQAMRDLEQYMPVLTEFATFVRRYVDTAMDVDTIAKLTSTSLNNEKAVGTAWSDDSSSYYADIIAAIRQFCPAVQGPDGMLVIGREAADNLLDHPDTLAQKANYASGDMVNRGELATMLSQKLEIPNVFVASKFYNSAADGLASSLALVAGNTCWAGVKRGLVLIEQPGSGEAESEYDFDNKVHKVSYDRTADVQRVNKSLGIVFTGI